MSTTLSRREFLAAGAVALSRAGAAAPPKLVVLTFDDAVKSHRTMVAPLLRELGFGATFFVTHLWMNDPENFMSWEDIGEIHKMGFEIGNHSWTHHNAAIPRNAARMAAELALVERELARVKVPRPVSYAYSGNCFGPEAVAQLQALGYRFARRGMQPEVGYGKITLGPAFDPQAHHPLLIPSTGDAYPDWSLDHFRRVVAEARDGKIAVLQFHGVPDPAHPWVHTPPDKFQEYMQFLKQEDFQVIAIRDLEAFAGEPAPKDPMLQVRYPTPKTGRMALPVEVEATRADLDYWVENMIDGHGYGLTEAAATAGVSEEEIARVHSRLVPKGDRSLGLSVRPYPGGRHPRIGFLNGAILPHRGTKASVFLPWDGAGYVVVDLPEAVFSNLGLLYLAHTHIPTIWDRQNVWLDNIDWTRGAGGSLSFRRDLPNGVSLGALVEPDLREIRMALWLHNGTSAPLTGLRTQVCVMLKGAPDFNGQTNDNKLLRSPVAAVRSSGRDRWILTSWERSGRVWANPPVPCLHSDPVLPDCAPGQTVEVRGRLWFFEGSEPEIGVGPQ